MNDTYAIIFTDENGNPDFSQRAVYVEYNVADADLEAAMTKITTVTEAIKVLEPNRNFGIFRMESIA